MELFWKDVLTVFDEIGSDSPTEAETIIETKPIIPSYLSCGEQQYYPDHYYPHQTNQSCNLNDSLDSIKKNDLTNLPPHPARFYAETITFALNDDINVLYQTLLSISTNDVQIVRRVYSLSTPDAAELGLQDMVFRNVEEFCYYMGVWNAMVPDGIFETSFHRVCVDTPPTYVFISNLRFTGHKLLKEMDLVGDRLQDQYWMLNQPLLQFHQYTVDYLPETTVFTGSLSVFVNKAGKVAKIEIYFNRQ